MASPKRRSLLDDLADAAGMTEKQKAAMSRLSKRAQRSFKEGLGEVAKMKTKVLDAAEKNGKGMEKVAQVARKHFSNLLKELSGDQKKQS